MPMRHRVLVCCAAGLCLAVLATISPASAQKPVAPKPRSGEGGWVVPRMADGHPDLQGTWENNSATPLERPAAFANKPLLTDAELADMKARAARLFAPDSDAAFGDGFYLALLANANTAPFGTGSYAANWLPNRNLERPHVAHHGSSRRQASAAHGNRDPRPRRGRWPHGRVFRRVPKTCS